MTDTPEQPVGHTAGNVTPGPYVADKADFHKTTWAMLNAGTLDIVRTGADVLAVVWVADDDNESGSAQAALFAAAPDLLEALKLARKYAAFYEACKHNGPWRDHENSQHLASIDAAITKATS